MSEEKRKINAWIPVSLYNKLESAGYENITQALIKAIEKLTEDPQEDTKGSTEDIERIQEGYLQDIAGYKEDLIRTQTDIERQNQDITGYKQDIERLKDDLARAPDLVTFTQLQARYEGLQEIIKEKEKSIERLENDLVKAGQREEDLKQMHNNYMLQVQSLINQRALSAPAGSTRKEEKPTQEKKESRPAHTEEKDTIQKECKHCGNIFYTDKKDKIYCDKKCKDDAYNEKRRKERQEK